MKCPKCGYENKESADHCDLCKEILSKKVISEQQTESMRPERSFSGILYKIFIRKGVLFVLLLILTTIFGFIRKHHNIRNNTVNIKQVWLKQFGSAFDEIITGLVLDTQGNVIITGWTEGNLGEIQELPQHDLFLAKYDRTGAKVWLRQYNKKTRYGGYLSFNKYSDEIVFYNQDKDIKYYDTDGNKKKELSYYRGRPDLCPVRPGYCSFMIDDYGNEYILDSYHKAYYYYGKKTKDIYHLFLRKYIAAGKGLLWEKEISALSEIDGFRLTRAESGNIIVAGYSRAATGNTIFCLKIDSSGKELLKKDFSLLDVYSTGDDKFGEVTDIFIDHINNVYIIGNTYPSNRGFIIKLNEQFEPQFLKNLQAEKTTFLYKLFVDDQENIYLAGIISTIGEKVDVYVAKFNKDGESEWLKLFGLNCYADVEILFNSLAEIYVCGDALQNFERKQTSKIKRDVFVSQWKIE